MNRWLGGIIRCLTWKRKKTTEQPVTNSSTVHTTSTEPEYDTSTGESVTEEEEPSCGGCGRKGYGYLCPY